MEDPQMSPRFSPDGNVVAFVRDNNLFVVKLLYGNAETQVTKDGKRNEVINGIPDWVNEEEFSTNASFDFSADRSDVVLGALRRVQSSRLSHADV